MITGSNRRNYFTVLLGLAFAGNVTAAPTVFSQGGGQTKSEYYSQANTQPVSNTSNWQGTGSVQYPAATFDNTRSYTTPEGDHIVTVGAIDLGSSVVLGGTVVPYQEVTLAAQIAGRVEYLAGVEGDWFEAQSLLLAIDDDDLLAQRRQAQAELGNTEAGMRNAQVQYSREMWAPQTKSLTRAPGMGLPSMFDQFFTQPFGSMTGGGNNPWLERQADLFAQGSQMNQAQSRVMQARSKLEEIDARLRDTKAVSPFSGVIVKKLAEVGDTVQPGQPLLVFANTQYLQIQVEVPARLMPGLEKDMIVPARLDVSDTQVEARVAQIFPMADTHRHTVTVKFDLPENVPGGPGMYAEVSVPDVSVQAQSLPIIPVSAILARGSLPSVMVVNDDNVTELRVVRLGEKLDEHSVTVLSGLLVGERLLVNPPAGIASGRHVGPKR